MFFKSRRETTVFDQFRFREGLKTRKQVGIQDSGRKNVMSMRELFCPDPPAGFEKMAGF